MTDNVHDDDFVYCLVLFCYDPILISPCGIFWINFRCFSHSCSVYSAESYTGITGGREEKKHARKKNRRDCLMKLLVFLNATENMI